MRYFLPLLFLPTPLLADADLIVHHAKVVTVDAKFSIAEAVAVQDGKIVAVGTNADVLKHKGPKTRVIDAGGKMVLPGLIDSHTHPIGAAMSEWKEPLPRSAVAQGCLRDTSARRPRRLPEGEWIVLRYAFPTRLEEARFPTKAELDEAAPKHPVLYHAGPAGDGQQHGAQGLRRHQGHAEPADRRRSSRTRRPASRPACSATPTACSRACRGERRHAASRPTTSGREEAVRALQRARPHQHRRPQRPAAATSTCTASCTRPAN